MCVRGQIFPATHRTLQTLFSPKQDLYNRSRISSDTSHAFQELLKGAREEVNRDEGESVSVALISCRSPVSTYEEEDTCVSYEEGDTCMS